MVSQPAQRAGDFWGVMAFFEPHPLPVSLANLRLAAARVRAQGLPLAVVELAFDAAPFRVADEDADLVIRKRSSTRLWHKERLLNLAIAALPASCRYVAWLDADVVFERDAWVEEARRVLEDEIVVQPFATAYWLGDGEHQVTGPRPQGLGEGLEMAGFAATMAGAEDRRGTLSDFTRHGHCGFAWAARRDFLARHGLYDRAIIGAGDAVAAHAFAADADYLRGRNFMLRNFTPAERHAIGAWGTPLAAETGGRMGWVAGRVLHLYHGPFRARQYQARHDILREGHFDPAADIALDESGCWRWATDKPALHASVAAYFAARAGAAPAAPAGATA